jgi:hypothetical protein
MNTNRPKDEVSRTDMQRPHVVILGAGASLAAFPNGDRNGRKLPVIKNFVEVLGLDKLLSENGIHGPFDDFEGIFSDIASDPTKTGLCALIEKQVFDYFASLELPDTPTLYDHLILSLRPKDVIATFNWDPFLWQAAARNYKFGQAPMLLFLHGNVAIGYCSVCKLVLRRGEVCDRCGHPSCGSPLLYPVKQKDYQTDPLIAADWRAIGNALKVAWAVTFFGYGAPKTDVEAVSLLKRGWGDPGDRNLEETEIIDIRPEPELDRTWSPFIHTHHRVIRRSFYDSYLAKHPRRSGEALWARLMECQFVKGANFPSTADFTELYEWLKPRIEAEWTNDSSQES